MRYDFDWDRRKAKVNTRKHGVTFEQAVTIFRDPNLLSIPDDEHSGDEERWITMGLDESGRLLVISHKFELVREISARVRIISARKATTREKRRYEKGI